MSHSMNEAASIDGDDVQDHTLLLDDLPQGYYRSKNFIGSVVGTAIMGVGLFNEYSMPTSSLAIINADIGPSPNFVLISTVPALLSGIGVVIVGRLGDIFGRRYFLIGGQILSLIGCTIAATSGSVTQLVGGGILIGLAATVQNTLLLIIAELVPNKHRALANGLLLLITLPTAGFGPGFARMIVENTSQGWRWFYYLSIIFAGIALILFVLFYFPPNFQQLHPTTTKRTEVKKLDYGGLVLYTGGLLILLIGLSWGGTRYAWNSSHVLGTIIMGIITLIAFAFYEAFAPLKQTLLPLSLLKDRNYIAVLVTSSVATMIYFSMNVIWPQQIAALYSTDNVQIGWLSCTIGASLVTGFALCGLFFRLIGHSKWQLVACSVAMTTFLGAMAASDQSNRALAIAFTVCGVTAVGYCELGTVIMASLICKPGDIGFAVGFVTSARLVSGSIAATIYQTILTNRLNTNIPSLVGPAAASAGLPSASLPTLLAALKAGTPEAIETVPGITPAIIAAINEPLKTAYAQSFKIVYLATIAFGGCAIIAACCSQNIERLMTNEVAKKLGRADRIDSSTDGDEEKIEESALGKRAMR